MTKIAKNQDDALEMHSVPKGPHGWIQWKGTGVCMDVRCKCGHLSHVDADFAYFVECSKCGTVYSCNGHIELIEVKDTSDINKDCVAIDEDDKMLNAVMKKIEEGENDE